MNIYLVEDVGNSPGKIYAVLQNDVDAEQFSDMLEEDTRVVERHLWYGQPGIQGMNP